jgi:biotin transport system substrate-specific component
MQRSATLRPRSGAGRGRTLIGGAAARGWVAPAIAVVAGTLLLWWSARTSFNLPFSPVPVTGQTFAALLIGAAYGSRLGTATAVAYIAQGLVGLPVFASGGSGWAWLSGPTGGYIFGFAAGAFVVGWLAERGWDRKPLTTALAMVAGNVAIYALGVANLQRFLGWDGVWAGGVQPFLVGDAVKIALAAGLLPAAWMVRERLAKL